MPHTGPGRCIHWFQSVQRKNGAGEAGRYVCDHVEQNEPEKTGAGGHVLCPGGVQRAAGALHQHPHGDGCGVGASITADKVKIPRKWDDSFSAFNGVVQQSGMDLTRCKGKTVEKWTALIPAASSGETSRYGVLLVWRKKAVGAYLLERPSGVVVGLKDLQTAMAEAQQTSGEDYSGDWGERHDEELDAQQTSGEDYSGDWGERHDEELTGDAAQQTSGEAGEQAQAVDYASLPLDAEGYPVE